MKFIHQIVTKDNRDITNTETTYSNSDKPKNSFKMYLKFMTNVQYEIINRYTNKITIVN
jgi:hypothetical protein